MPRTRRSEAAQERRGFEVPGVTMLPASSLLPSPYNPRSISPAAFESLKAGIRQFGMVEPLVVQRVSERHGERVLVGGHQRLKAMREISIEDNVAIPPVPCVVLDLDDRRAKILNVALNNVTGEFDARLLAELVEDVHASRAIDEVDARLLGMEDEEIRKYLKLSEPPIVAGVEESPAFGRSVTLGLVFSDVRERDAVKAKLEELAGAQGKKTGDIVLGLLDRKKR